MNRPLNFQLTEAEKGYVAGLIDGEGSIIISQAHEVYVTRAQETRNYTHLRLWLQISMSRTECFDWLQERIPRAALLGKYVRKDRKNNKPMYMWKLYGGGAVQVLEQILPYLILKKRQAELAIEFQSMKKMGGAGAHLSPAMKQRSEEIRMELKHLNKRGVETEIEEVRVLG